VALLFCGLFILSDFLRRSTVVLCVRVIVLNLGLLNNSGEKERLSLAIVRLSVKRVRSGARVLESVGVVVKLVPAAAATML
jgi:hypothetical protein